MVLPCVTDMLHSFLLFFSLSKIGKDGGPPAGSDLRPLHAAFLFQSLFHLFLFCHLILSTGSGLFHIDHHCSALA